MKLRIEAVVKAFSCVEWVTMDGEEQKVSVRLNLEEISKNVTVVERTASGAEVGRRPEVRVIKFTTMMHFSSRKQAEGWIKRRGIIEGSVIRFTANGIDVMAKMEDHSMRGSRLYGPSLSFVSFTNPKNFTVVK